jgi:hypothetical protein
MTEPETGVPTAADISVKKPKRGRRGRSGSLTEAVLATSQLFQDLSAASADAFAAFSAEVANDDTDLVRSVAMGFAEGNATFVRGAADAPVRYVDRMIPARTRRVRGEIDYERLAKLVAAELAKQGSAT